MIPLIKTDRSIGKSIIQIDTPNLEKYKAEDPDTIVTIALEQGWKRVYIVDDSVGGFIPIYRELEKHGIQLVYGWRVSFVQDAADIENEQPSHKNIIFITSESGWKKLIKLSSLAETDFFFKEARLDYKTFHEHYDENLVLAVPGYDSFIHKNLTTKTSSIPDFRGIIPYFFLESQDLPFDDLIKSGVENYIAANGGKIVSTKSIYYKNREDCFIYMARRLMQKKGDKGKKSTLEAPNLEFFCSDDFCIDSWIESKDVIGPYEKEFESLFDKPLSLFLPGIRLPKFVLKEDQYEKHGIPKDATNPEILRILTRHGYKRRLEAGEIDKARATEYGERVNYELGILDSMNFSDYILMVYEIMDYVKTKGLPTSDGRGSGAGSLVNFLLRITEVDPIPNTLFFERFINPSRGKTTIIDGVKYLEQVPDLDLDFGMAARDEVISILKERYPNRICKLSTVATFLAKNTTKICAKVIEGIEEDDIRKVTDEVEKVAGKTASVENTYKDSERFREFMDKYPRVWKAVKKLQGGLLNIGSHASAYAVTYSTLDQEMPIQKGKEENITSFDMYTAESLCIKLDLLGLNTVTLLDNTAKAVGLDVKKIDYNSWDIFKHLQNLQHPVGLFQISGDSAVRGLNKIKPKNMEMLSIVLSICRPGAYSVLDSYADFVNGRAEAPSLHPLFDELLRPFGNIAVYQELLMAMLVKVGFSLTESDTLRRIVSKKKDDEIDAWEVKIYERAKETGVPVEAAKVVWDLAKASASYSFNRCIFEEELVVHQYNGQVMIKDIVSGDWVKTYNPQTGQDGFCKVKNVYYNVKLCYKVIFQNGCSLRTSGSHKFLVESLGKIQMMELHKCEELSMLATPLFFFTEKGKTQMARIEPLDSLKTVDLEIESYHHNFYCNGVVVSNSHSWAYSRTTAQSVLLKFTWPLQFYTEALKLSKEQQEPIEEIRAIARELHSFNIKLLPPDLVLSDSEFKVEGDSIRYGLSSIKSVKDQSVEKIRKFTDKENSNLFSLFQAVEQAKVNSLVFVSLIEAGCLGSLSKNRQVATLAWRIWHELTPRERQYLILNGEKYNYDVIFALQSFLEWTTSEGKRFGKESRLNTLRKKCEPYFLIYKENLKNPNVAEYMFESALLGFSPSHTLRSLFTEYPNLHSVQHINENLHIKEKVRLVAEVVEVRVATAKVSERKYCKMILADETGKIDAGFFGDNWAEYSAKHPSPEEGQIIYVEAQKGDGILFISDGEIQHLPVYMRVRDLRKMIKPEEVRQDEVSD